MRTLVLVLLLPLLLAGCAFGGNDGRGDESAEDVVHRDLSSYDGGMGVAFSVTNDGSAPFDVAVRAIDDNGTELALLDVEVAPNETHERWWSIDQVQFNVSMEYVFRAASGGVRTGDDDRRLDLRGCPVVTRVAWRFIETNETVGSAFLGARCVDEP